MASDLLQKFGKGIMELTLIPSGSGVYEVTKNGNLVFSKRKIGRFPELDEIIALIEK